MAACTGRRAPGSAFCFFFSSRRRHTRCSRDWSSDVCFFFPSRRRHTRCSRDWSSDVCSSDLHLLQKGSLCSVPLALGGSSKQFGSYESGLPGRPSELTEGRNQERFFCS